MTPDQITGIDSSLVNGLVNIYTVLGYEQAQGAGTGMVLSANGEVLTNNHVIDGSTEIRVDIVATGQSYAAHVVGTAATEDVAVLQLDGATGLSPIRIGSSSAVRVGDDITAIGNAGGRGVPTVAPGQVVALDQTITATDGLGSNTETLDGLIQVSANLQAGESGGPTYNANGEVIGMNTAGSAGNGRFRTRTGEGFLIPIDLAVDLAKQIEAGKASDTIYIGVPGFLGVATSDFATAAVTGARIDQVVPSSPAESVGLQVGWVITAIDGKATPTTDDVANAIHDHRGGETIKVTYRDASGATGTVTAVLIEGPAN